MLSRTIHVTPLSAPTVTAPVASAPMAGGDGNHDLPVRDLLAAKG
jgi:hypothetical protein